ncbi:hypothetical protein PRIPAC_76179 [Pristionchus pacificus]|uniref:Uncharacterized protein n=1 Tax=Pristionchus pacificus TaxID=54126 RepID=A0A2A6C0D3_PRIPA|nr:hypothetical protein PRIPAC_76179 [Pristionchus pacificus]|eukprot:PDM71547.1 hypothetical protein PRIPAC_37954 [Pristionchus pacificus]
MIPLAALYYTLAAAVAAATVIGSCCMKQKKTEATRRSASLKHFHDDLEVSTNKTQESPRGERTLPTTTTATQTQLQLTSIKTARARPESRRVKDIAQRREGRRRHENPPSSCRNRRVVATAQRSNISLTGKRGPNSLTPSSGKGAPSYTAKNSRRRGPQLTSDSRPRRRSLLERASNMAKRTREKKKSDKKAKENQRKKMLDLTDSDEESEDSEAMRHRMTFPADPYNQRVPSYTAPDGRVLTPKVEPLAGKEAIFEQIAIRREFRKAVEYPTMEDIKSMWDSIENKDEGGGGGGRGRGRRRSGTSSSKKKGPVPRSSETPTDTQKTSEAEPRGALQPIAAGGGVTAAAAAGAGGLSNRPSKTDVEDC